MKTPSAGNCKRRTKEEEVVGIFRDLSPPAVVDAIEANLVSFFPLFARLPNAEIHLGSDLLWSITEIAYPLFNSILGTRLEPHRVDAVIAEAVARGRAKKVPLLWWTGPATRPADLGRSLESHGFVHAGNAPGMAADLLALDESFTAPAGLEIAEIQDAESLETWCRTAAAGYELPDVVTDAWLVWYCAVGLNQDPPLRHFIGMLRGKPVAVASLFLASGVAGIYNVATVPEARRQGIGALITLEALRRARTAGFRVGVLQSSDMGVGIYGRLGFREFCRIDHYLWNDG
jgi:ribosomal protein S18 acetylase RimI-like enzyme